MKIYFLRHGQADWPNWNKPDDERPLTRKGKKEVKRVAKFLCGLEPRISRILSSPLPRALQTAEIAGAHLSVKVEKEPALAEGFSAAKLRQILKRSKQGDLMLVGHEPSFSQVICELTGGKVKLSKTGLALVDLAESTSAGQLVWLIPPKLANI